MKWISGVGVRSLLLVAGLGVAGAADAQNFTISQEYGKLIQSRLEMPGGGDVDFGDEVNMYTGQLELRTTDVSVPGNNGLDVAVGRRFTLDQTSTVRGSFGDWDLDIPHLHGVFSRVAGWVIPGPAVKYNRCSQFGPPPVVGGTFDPTAVFEYHEYWHGSHLYLPGQGSQLLLSRNGGTVPSTGGPYPLVTRNGAVIRCLSSLTAASRGQGEGFEVITPDGVHYRFDHMVKRGAPATV